MVARFPTHFAFAIAVAATIAIAPSMAAAQPGKQWAYNWTGWYVGGNVGYAWGNDGAVNFNTTGSTATPPLFPPLDAEIVALQQAALGPLDTKPQGVLGGLQTGYNYQFGAFVFGLETDFDWTNIDGSSGRTVHSEFTTAPGFGITTNVTARERLDDLGTVRARLGVTPLPTLLLYGTGGFAYGHASSDVSVSEFETGPFCSTGIAFTPSSGSHSSTLTGWTAGGGGEWAFAPNLSVKAEYLHYDLGTMHYSANQITSISAPCAGPPNTPFASVNASPSADFKGDLVRMGLNFKLGGL
jgi:outer membrane immunogenic protein